MIKEKFTIENSVNKDIDSIKSEFREILSKYKYRIDDIIISLPKDLNLFIDENFIEEIKDKSIFVSKRLIDDDTTDNIYIYLMTKTNYKIALDGPSGSGKSTIAKLLAGVIGINYLDTGAMYRAITLKILDSEVDLKDKEKIKQILNNTDLSYKENTLYIDNKAVGSEIRTDRVTKNVSLISSYDFVREKLVNMQREIASSTSSILDGRDIGTVVLKDADYKIFLTASPEIRANRRFEQIDGKEDLTYEYILEDIKRRDKFDTERKISPLKKADDAIEIDSSNMDINTVVETILNIIRNN